MDPAKIAVADRRRHRRVAPDYRAGCASLCQRGCVVANRWRGPRFAELWRGVRQGRTLARSRSWCSRATQAVKSVPTKGSARAQELEILNILNWPVESRRGAPVERWRGYGFRRPAPSHLCLDTPLPLRFLSPLIEPSVRISRTGLSFEIMRSHTRSRAVRPVRRSRPLCDRPPGKRTSSRTPPRASAPATDATAVSPAPVLPTAAARPPGTRFTSHM